MVSGGTGIDATMQLEVFVFSYYGSCMLNSLTSGRREWNKPLPGYS